MIVILTERGDAHADRVESMLRGSGSRVLRFDPADFPGATSASLSIAPSDDVRPPLLWIGGESFDLSTVESIWHRRPRRPAAEASVVDEAARTYVEEESATFLEDLWESLPCAYLPARYWVMRRAALKAAQLRLARGIGFETPPTLVTNDRGRLARFFREHRGRIVSKTVGPARLARNGDGVGRHTEFVSHRDIGYLHSLRYCPMIFQAYVEKRFELRVTVVGKRLFAAEIHSQEAHHTRHDYRRYDEAHTRYAVHDMPPAVAERCVEITGRLGLGFAALDLILTPEGRYVFLELNPNGQYLWIEERTGLPISRAIHDLLREPATLSRAPSVLGAVHA